MAERTVIVTSADATVVKYQTDHTTVVTTDATGPQGPQGAPGTGIEVLNAKGDLLGYSTAGARVPIGTNGHVLTADSAQALGLKWAAPDVTQAELDAHAAVTSSVHGISAFGATLVDDADAATARTTLGLGSAATSASTAFVASTLPDAKGDLFTATAADTPARLAVGTDGHVLTADSAQSTGIKWAAASGGFDANAAHLNTSSFAFPYCQVLPGSVATLSVQYRLHLSPLYLPKAITVTGMLLRVTSAGGAGSVARLGIYASSELSASGGSLVLNAGTVAIDSTGVKTITGLSTSLAAGWYLVGLVHDATSVNVVYDDVRTFVGDQWDRNTTNNPQTEFWYAANGSTTLASTCPSLTAANNLLSNKPMFFTPISWTQA